MMCMRCSPEARSQKLVRVCAGVMLQTLYAALLYQTTTTIPPLNSKQTLHQRAARHRRTLNQELMQQMLFPFLAQQR